MPKGFSATELVTVILLLSLLAVYGIEKLPRGNFALSTESDQLVQHVRYAQFLAVTSGARIKIQFNTGGYDLADLTGNSHVFPDVNSNAVSLQGGHTLSSTHSLLVFDAVGQPYVDQNIPGTPLTGAASITLSGNGNSNTVQVTESTGKVSKL